MKKITQTSTKNTLDKMKADHEAEMEALARKRVEDRLRRIKNQVTTKKLDSVIKDSEAKEEKTFRLRDRTTELKHELEISKSIRDEILDYIQFEKKKNARLIKQKKEL